VVKAMSLPQSGTPEKIYQYARLLLYQQTLGYVEKVLPGTNTVAYFENSKSTDAKSFITLGPS
jgi:hypothetical protein